jgi:hypothetical protein
MSAEPQAETISSAERLFREDLVSTSFIAGADRGYWRIASLIWPFAVIEIAAAGRSSAPPWWAFQFDLTGYPQAPTARPWDLTANAPLAGEHWPAGGPRIMAAFNPGWRVDALYIPVDRLALEGHDVWRQRHPSYIWDPALDITQYLRIVHGLLNDPSYTGSRG